MEQAPIAACPLEASVGQPVANAEIGGLCAPGSPDAVAHGCTCPVMDNGNGAGCGYTSELAPGEPLYWFDFGCPLHGNNESIAPETRCYEMPNALAQAAGAKATEETAGGSTGSPAATGSASGDSEKG